MTEPNEPRIYLAAPIGQPLPIMQPMTSDTDHGAWAQNYGNAWAHPAPDPSLWRIERFVRFGDGHPSRQHILGIASVEGDESGDVLIVYDTLFRAQIWRRSRQLAETMWPNLLRHATENGPKPQEQ